MDDKASNGTRAAISVQGSLNRESASPIPLGEISPNSTSLIEFAKFVGLLALLTKIAKCRLCSNSCNCSTSDFKMRQDNRQNILSNIEVFIQKRSAFSEAIGNLAELEL
jgi:hypothetical protein